jgi:peptidoglycan DL-endopeptidase CwlO
LAGRAWLRLRLRLRRRRRVAAGFILLSALALLVGVAAADSVGAEPRFADRHVRLQEVLGEIDDLDVRLEQTVEAYNGATDRLARIKHARAVHMRLLRFARGQLVIAQQRLGERLRAIYMSDGEESTLAILLGSTSPSDLMDRWEAVRMVAAQDRQVLDQVRRFEQRVTRQDFRLEQAAGRQERLIADRAAAKRRIEVALRKRRELASSIQAELTRIRAAERAQQRMLAGKLMRRLPAQERSRMRLLAAAGQQEVVGASAVSPDGDITVAPPSPYSRVVGIAMHYLGVPYVWGGASPEGFDCSGLVMYVYAKVGVSLPHFAAYQFDVGVPVARSDLEPGDLVFFHKLGHVGMYIGDGYIIQAPNTGDVVKISNLSEPWFANHYNGARRIL